MNFYITSGTFSFLKKLKEKHSGENMLLLGYDETAALFHETSGKTVFSQPRKYEVIDSSGTTFANARYAVLNNIPVTDEGRPLFEYRMKNRHRLIEKQPGFVALRVLRPQTSNTYVILTLWENQALFNKWKETESFKQTHQNQTGPQTTTIFAGPTYVTTFSIAEEE